MDKITPKPFILKNENQQKIGHGIYYQYGSNTKVFLKSSEYASWQEATLGQVLLLKEVASFEWVKDKDY
ncbi:hypothetical protein C6497_13870 [Candidatus Poribacteria bacterium]|nr:MAG: hypothetical protein C6497_13870 [Candidatus Poribacteria bacterium]